MLVLVLEVNVTTLVVVVEVGEEVKRGIVGVVVVEGAHLGVIDLEPVLHLPNSGGLNQVSAPELGESEIRIETVWGEKRNVLL